MSFDKIAEKKIRDAMREGKFDDLPNAGSPIDLEDYFKAPEDLRMAYGVLKSAGTMPEEAEWLGDRGFKKPVSSCRSAWSGIARRGRRLLVSIRLKPDPTN